MQFLNPESWAKPRGYSNGVLAEGRQVFVAGQIGWNAEGRFETDSLGAQAAQALANTLEVLKLAGAEPGHIVRMTWYVTDKTEYLGALAEIGAAYRRLIGKHYPAMTLVQVAALLEDRAKVEIETTAVIPG